MFLRHHASEFHISFRVDFHSWTRAGKDACIRNWTRFLHVGVRYPSGQMAAAKSRFGWLIHGQGALQVINIIDVSVQRKLKSAKRAERVLRWGKKLLACSSEKMPLSSSSQYSVGVILDKDLHTHAHAKMNSLQQDPFILVVNMSRGILLFQGLDSVPA